MIGSIFTKKKKEFSLYCSLIGNPGIGKKKFVLKYLSGKYPEAEEFHVLDASHYKQVPMDQKICNLDITILDITEENQVFADSYLKGAEILIFCFAVNDASSFVDLNPLIKKLNNFRGNDDIFFILGLKTDLERQVFPEQVYRDLKGFQNFHYYEISSKTDQNQDDIMMNLMKTYLDFKEKQPKKMPVQKGKGLFSSKINSEEGKDDLKEFQNKK